MSLLSQSLDDLLNNAIDIDRLGFGSFSSDSNTMTQIMDVNFDHEVFESYFSKFSNKCWKMNLIFLV